MALLDIENLSVRYGKIEAVKRLSLQIKDANKCVAIVGSNGAGKSTLVNAITGLQEYDGIIKFKGEDLRGLSTQKRVIKGIVQCPERRFLFDYMTVKENLLLGTYNSGKNRYITIDRVYELFPVLKERLNQQAYTLSGGQAQMTAIGRSLLANPQLLILDEPTLGLAPIVRNHLSQALEEIKKYGLNIMLVEQNVRWSFDLSEYVYFMREGEIAKAGSREQISIDEEIRRNFLGV